MFGRTSNNSNKKEQSSAKDEKVRKESQIEEGLQGIQPMGNQAAIGMPPHLPNAGNQAVNDLLSNHGPKKLDLTISDHMSEWWDEIFGDKGGNDNLSEISDIDTSSKKNRKNKILDDEQEIEFDIDEPDQKVIKKAAKTAKNILKDKVPEADDQSLDTYTLEEDMRAHSSGKKGKKGNKAAGMAVPDLVGNMEEVEEPRWKKEAPNRLQTLELPGGEDRDTFIADEMKKIKNWDFAPQKLDKIEKTGKGRRLLSYFARGVGTVLGALVNALTFGYFWRSRSSVRSQLKSKNSWQQETDHQSIPGWDGAKYDPNATSGKDVMADFRRVPTVWSHLTAAKAAEPVERNGEETERPLDPVVSVLVDQPVSGSSQTMDFKNMGHVMLGIEYSRKSLISNRYERYKVQYGFYPQNGNMGVSAVGVMMKDNAVIPGELHDDSGHSYDVSRRYPAKPAQVNAIFEASEKYADGGYGYYDRNCATFAKEMVVNTAHLATGGDIFRKSEIQFSHAANLVLMAASALNENTKAGAETMLMDNSEKDAVNYQKYGSKQVTARDWANYKASVRNSSKWKKETYTPAEVAEHMRRMEGDETGEIGSFKYNDPLKNENGNVIVNLDTIKEGITKIGDRFQEKFQDFLTEQQLQQAPRELSNFFNQIALFGMPLGDLMDSIQRNLDKFNEGKKDDEKLQINDIEDQYFVSPEELRAARDELSEKISWINLVLYKYFKNDKRMHNDLMNMISLLNYGIEYIDTLYSRSILGGKTSKYEPTDIREEMTQNEYLLRAGGEEATFTPTHYESYIQIYKKPEIAIAKYSRLKELREKKKESGGWVGHVIKENLHKAKSFLNLEQEGDLTFAEARELKILEQMDDLASQFDNAHNYMIEKDQYSQQDIDYAFRLHDKETKGLQKNKEVEPGEKDVNENFRDNYKSASGIYISLFLNKIFPDIKEKWMAGPEKGGLPLEQMQDQTITRGWIDNYFMEHIKSKENDLQMIIRGLYRAMKAEKPKGKVKLDKLMEKIADMLAAILVERNFKQVSVDLKEVFGNIRMINYLQALGKDNSLQFAKMLNHMIAVCRREDSNKPQDKMVLD